MNYADIPYSWSAREWRLQSYCMQDSVLVYKIFEKLKWLNMLPALSQLTGVPLQLMVNRGTSVQPCQLITRWFHKMGWCIHILNPAWFDPENPNPKNVRTQATYQGAFTIAPVEGPHMWVMTHDFMSLYPSITITLNLCWSTYNKETDSFNTEYEGVLPNLYKHLLQERKAVKILMKNHQESSDEYKALDAQQLAFKLAANSCYGFSGSEKMQFPLIKLAAAITGGGRDYLERVIKIANSQFKCECVYGDTDSIFPKIPDEKADTSSYDEVAAFSKQMCDSINAQLPSTMILEDEKVYETLVCVKSKMYYGLIVYRDTKTNELKYKKDIKGIDLKRRGIPPLFKRCLSHVVDCILEKRPQDLAGVLCPAINSLRNGKCNYKELICSQSVSRPLDQYQNPPSMYAAIQGMVSRGERLPNIGDRINYVLINNGKKNVSHRSELPEIAQELNLPLDYNHYEQNLIKKIERLLQPCGIDIHKITDGNRLNSWFGIPKEIIRINYIRNTIQSGVKRRKTSHSKQADIRSLFK